VSGVAKPYLLRTFGPGAWTTARYGTRARALAALELHRRLGTSASLVRLCPGGDETWIAATPGSARGEGTVAA
jgi:hypothetical protein